MYAVHCHPRCGTAADGTQRRPAKGRQNAFFRPSGALFMLLLRSRGSRRGLPSCARFAGWLVPAPLLCALCECSPTSDYVRENPFRACRLVFAFRRGAAADDSPVGSRASEPAGFLTRDSALGSPGKKSEPDGQTSPLDCSRSNNSGCKPGRKSFVGVANAAFVRVFLLL